MTRIGILAVQGAFAEHAQVLGRLGADCVELRKRADIAKLDGLILPGGESTVQGKLLRELDMFEALRREIAGGLPTLATCAGLILLSEEIANGDNRCFATLPVCVRRNAYGRQLGSFQAVGEVKGLGDFEMVFIRAPYVESVGEGVEVLAKVDGRIVAVRYKNQLGMAFHPELGGDDRIHKMFLDSI